MEDNDNKPEKKINFPPIPPIPPGFMKSGYPLPPNPPGGGGAVQSAQQQAFSAPAAPQPPQRDAAAEESARMKEEKNKLEKKIAEMEKIVSQEKEKALLATLKNQQDEALSSKVESSLKDIQDRLRRDRHEQEVQEERLTLKSKVKDLETRLVAERETWMQTLKGQINERETQSKDVEGHFLYRLQEMERRWLEEKAQWQRTISQKEDEVRSLKSSAEKLREVEDEFRRAAMEKEMQAREISKLKDEVAKIDREKASVEAYIKNIPEREREFSDVRAENAGLRAREENVRNDSKLAEEKYRFEMDKMRKEIGRLQADIGAISDRKNVEKDEELRKLQTRCELTLQDKEKAVADITGEKIRALSELVKMKGFVSRVQAINAVLEKERQSLRLEKMQMAQAMASNIEDSKKLKSEMEKQKAAGQCEIEGLMKSYQAEIQKFKNEYDGQFAAGHARELADLQRRHQEELAKAKAASAAEMESGIAEMRAGVRRELEQEYASELARLKAEKARAGDEKTALEAALQRGAEEARCFDAQLAGVRRECEDSKAPMAENYMRLETQLNSLIALKADFERRFSVIDGDRTRLETDFSRLSAEYSMVKAQLDVALAAKTSREAEFARASQDLRTESENRARFESELQLLKQKTQQLELQLDAAQAAKVSREAELAGASQNLRTESENRARFESELQLLKQKMQQLELQLDAALTSKSAREAELAGVSQDLKTESGNRARFESELLFLKQKVQQLELQLQDSARQIETEKQSAILAGEEASRAAQADQARVDALAAELEGYKQMESSFSGRMKWAFKGKEAK